MSLFVRENVLFIYFLRSFEFVFSEQISLGKKINTRNKLVNIVVLTKNFMIELMTSE